MYVDPAHHECLSGKSYVGVCCDAVSHMAPALVRGAFGFHRYADCRTCSRSNSFVSAISTMLDTTGFCLHDFYPSWVHVRTRASGPMSLKLFQLAPTIQCIRAGGSLHSCGRIGHGRRVVDGCAAMGFGGVFAGRLESHAFPLLVGDDRCGWEL
ncbi:hypothetical protein BDV95DRAFT_385462 [Massariosphaeria phaeospora]|uniref:Uncharacterized protein n=1 Tax=Massariosphaeria phaeospora TaxID=100035 RepID=A0A7C8I794_9PLEO|nr:hypothetical protein BDV95DRAFT_385462 [Massariosphaeria phaeospora]